MLKHMRKHVIRHMSGRHVLVDVLGNLPGLMPSYVLKHVSDNYMLEYVH